MQDMSPQTRLLHAHARVRKRICEAGNDELDCRPSLIGSAPMLIDSVRLAL